MAVFYVCPWTDFPSGGIKQIFRHVEALSAKGFDAFVLSLDRRLPSWFEAAAPVAWLEQPPAEGGQAQAGARAARIDWLSSPTPPVVEVGGERRRLAASDVLVLPEFFGAALRPCGFGSKLVVFNQNAHYTFNGVKATEARPDLVYRGHAVAALAVSSHTADYLRYAFPDLDVRLTPNGVDVSVFRPGGPKRRQIAYMPRKLPTTAVQVLQMLRSRGVLEGWTLRPIDGVAEGEVAQALRESEIFLSTCHDEGFGLPPLEAGASGCIVVGYTGYAAAEFMLPAHCHPVPQGDVLGFARTLEQVLIDVDARPAELRRKSAAFVDFVRRRYSKEAEADHVVAAWSQLAATHAEIRLPTHR